jgi:hypothetical protein
MASGCTCYKLTGKTFDGQEVQYYGQVAVGFSQTNQDAADYRNRIHKSCRKWCLSRVDPATMSCTAVGHKLWPQDALLQEVVLTVIAWHADDTVRGGPYTLRHMLPSQVEELNALKVICELRTYAAQRLRVKEIAMRMPVSSSLRRHVEDRCYQCSRPGWKTCPCRGQKKNSLVHGGGSRIASSSSISSGSSSSNAVSLLMQPQAVFALKKRASGKRVPMMRAKHYMKKTARAPQKPKNGCSRLKDKIRHRKLVKNSVPALEFKYGTMYVANRQTVNAKHYRKRVGK